MAWPLPEGRAAKGTVLVLQGRTECIEKYYETIGELIARGFAVAAFDWRGQGLSDRQLADRHKGHVRDFAEYLRDMDCVMDSFVAPNPGLPQPYIILAHSMGAHVAVRYLQAHDTRFQKAVLCSPMAYINGAPIPHLMARGVAAVTAIGFSARYVPGGRGYNAGRDAFAGNVLTGDAGRFARNAAILADNPDLAIGSPTLGWLQAAYRSMALALKPKFCAAIKTPCLIVYGSNEQVSLPHYQALLASRLGNGRAQSIAGARHEILQETDEIRARFWALFDEFVS